MNRIDIEHVIIKNLFRKDSFTQRVFPFLKEEYFELEECRFMFEVFEKYYNKYSKSISKESMIIELEETNAREQLLDVCYKSLEDFYSSDVEHDDEWLIDASEKFCQDQSVKNAIDLSINILDGNDKNRDKSAIPEILKDALSIDFNPNLGHDYMNSAELRYEMYHDKVTRIPFDLDYLNKITDGGLPKKSLTVFMGPSGTGKSHILCHLASSYLRDGKNVFFITLELSEQMVAERIDANLYNVDVSMVKKLPKESYINMFEKVKGKGMGNLFIKEYPTSSAHAGHVRHYLNDVILKTGIVPDILIVDYLGICLSQRYAKAVNKNSHDMLKSISEEMRGLASEFNVPLISAAQTNRGGYDNTDISMTDTATSIGLPETCDLLLAIIRTDEFDKMGYVMLKQLKNRYSDPADIRKFLVGTNRNRMKLFNIPESEQRRCGGSSSGAGGSQASTPNASPAGSGGFWGG